MIFQSYHLPLVLSGRKTMTRRLHSRPLREGRRYRLKRDWYHWLNHEVLITRRFQQRLGDISEEDAYNEGYCSIEEFQKAWIEIHGEWNPHLIVWVYEFKVIR